MKIKKYRVDSMKEGLAQIKRELGPEAMIIESRKCRRKGFRGFFLPKIIEITAAIDSFDLQSDYRRDSLKEKENKVEADLDQLKNMVAKILVSQEERQLSGDVFFNTWFKFLTANDIDDNLARKMLLDIQNKAAGKEISSEVAVTLIAGKMKEMLLTARISPHTKYITFVGPTGVGKTTTLAKLAAYYTFEEEKDVAIITVDTYRIGAVEQLKTYAGITGIPIEVVLTKDEMKKTIKKFHKKEIVLVDTAGRSLKNTMQISETASYLNQLPSGVVFLVISATTKSQDLKPIAQGFKRLNYSHLIFTKLDETETCGGLLNVCHFTSKPIAYITAGQRVPEDIEIADAGKLVGKILGVVQG